MTLQKLLTKINDEKPNAFGNERLISFVNEIEGTVAEQLHKNPVSYTADDMDKELLAPAPYDTLYVSWVKSQIDYAHEEYASYQLNQEQFSADMEEFIDWIVRTKQAVEAVFPSRFRHIF